MCFVLDINAFHIVFNTSHCTHKEFKPLLKWLYGQPKTCLVVGGTHYRNELKNLNSHLARLVELRRAGKLRYICDSLVDQEETRLKMTVQHKNFDDPHIVAIFCVSGCRIFASKDKRADPFIKMKKLYPKGQTPPSIYRSHTQKSLLCNSNIVSLRNVT